MPHIPPTDVLNYAEPRTIEPLPPVLKSREFRVVVVCWIVPLLIGLAIFGMARLNRPYEVVYKYDADSGEAPLPNAADRRRGLLEAAGFLDIASGTVLAVVGLFCIVGFAVQRSRPAPNRITGLAVPILLMLFLLASNFVVALLCLGAVG